MSRILRAGLDRAVDVVLPGRCAGCGNRAAGLCAGCLARAARPAPRLVPVPLAWWVTPLSYEGAVREAVARIKYRNHRDAVAPLAAILAGALAPVVALHPIDACTWIPTDPARRRIRGFDHAELLARRVSRLLGTSCHALLLHTGGVRQTGRTRSERQRNPPEFCARMPVPARILLVDDVVTTGATATSAARALLAAGATHVGLATVARTPER